MALRITESEHLSTVELVVRRYCDLFKITDVEDKADIITRVLVMYEHGLTDEVDLMAKLLQSNESRDSKLRRA